jgi:hypothetical protein
MKVPSQTPYELIDTMQTYRAITGSDDVFSWNTEDTKETVRVTPNSITYERTHDDTITVLTIKPEGTNTHFTTHTYQGNTLTKRITDNDFTDGTDQAWRKDYERLTELVTIAKHYQPLHIH